MAMNYLGKVQKAALAAYEDGEYAELLTSDDVDECGDGLIVFLVHELSDLDDDEIAEDRLVDEVQRRIQVAIDELLDVQNAFADALARVAVKDDKAE